MLCTLSILYYVYKGKYGEDVVINNNSIVSKINIKSY